MKQNHYEALRVSWRQKITNMDRQLLLRRLPFLRLTDDRITLEYFNKTYTIDSDGVVCGPGNVSPIPLYDELNIHTLLWYAKEGATLTGRWVPFSQLKGASPFGPAFSRGTLQPFASTFCGHSAQLEDALIALGGRRLPIGDVGYNLNTFSCIPVKVLFWDGDDEFPAQVNLLFDESATDYIHVESIVTIASQLLQNLAEEAALPMCHQAF